MDKNELDKAYCRLKRNLDNWYDGELLLKPDGDAEVSADEYVKLYFAGGWYSDRHSGWTRIV